MNFRCVAAVLALCAAAAALAQDLDDSKDNIAGPYVPTPWVIVQEMLKLADVRGEDVVYDLGSGDGRLVITAAKRFGARGVGVELQSELVEMARAGAEREGVANRVKFVQGDLFETDIRSASVVMLYLLPRFVTRLVPRFRAELKAGTRIVSHDYPLAPWPPDKEFAMDVPEKEMISGTSWTRLYYYVVPARVQGVWELILPDRSPSPRSCSRLRRNPTPSAPSCGTAATSPP
jgi:SAM-dependent methyltransferase